MQGWQQLGVIRERLRVIVLMTAIGGLAAVAIAMATPKQYEATVRLLVGQVIDAENPDLNAVLLAERLSRTFAILATTRPVITDVIDTLHLGTDPSELLLRVSSRADLDSPYIAVTVRDGDPERAARIANAFGDALESRSPTTSDTGVPSTPRPLVRVVEQATPPKDPTSPRVLLYVLLGLIMGASLGIGLAFFIELVRPRPRTIGAVATTTGLPIVAVFQQRGRRRSSDDATASLTAAEGPEYEILRANLAEVRSADRPKTVVVTAPSPGAGTTTIAVKLALAFADSGDRTILVEGNAGDPRLGKLFRVGESSASTSGALSGPLTSVLHATRYPRLRIVPSGLGLENQAAHPRPYELRDALNRVAGEGDVVVVDGAPILGGVDGPTLAAVGQAVVLVVDMKRSSLAEIEASQMVLARVGAKVVGVAINRHTVRPWSRWNDSALGPVLDRIAGALRPARKGTGRSASK